MTEQKITIIEALDILEKMAFFGGCRAGRELWATKPAEVQNEDIENFNRDIQRIKEYLIANAWKSVNRETPEDFERVLAWIKWKNGNEEGYIYGFTYCVEGLWYGDAFGASREVVAWMPLPPKYEGETA